MKWGWEFIEAGIIHGEPVYCWHRIRPRWYWHGMRLVLFFGIVFRRWDYVRLWPKLAWEIATDVYRNELEMP